MPKSIHTLLLTEIKSIEDKLAGIKQRVENSAVNVKKMTEDELKNELAEIETLREKVILALNRLVE